MQGFQNFISRTWGSGKRGKIGIGCAALVFLCVVCSVIAQIYSATPQGQASATAQAVNANATKDAGATKEAGAERTRAALAAAADARLTDVAMPTETSEPTRTMSPTPSIAVRVDAPALLDLNANGVREILGNGYGETEMSAGSIPELPRGGKVISFDKDSYRIDVTFDNSDKSIGVFLDGLDEFQFTLDDWKTYLPQFGVDVTAPPDESAPAARRWKNVNGTRVNVFAGLNKPVYMIQVWANEAPAASTSPRASAKGMGIARADIQSKFQLLGFSFEQGAPVNGQENWIGESKDNALVQLIGPRENLTQAAVTVFVSGADEQARQRALVYLLGMLVAVDPNWDDGAEWLGAALKDVSDDKNVSIVRGNMRATLSASTTLGAIVLTFEGN